MADLFVMCGVPGSGKTTFIKSFINEHNDGSYVHVSRDEIRFSLLKPNEEYFLHEKLVYTKFCAAINEALAAGKNVFADQTSLNTISRKKLLNHVRGYDNIYALYMDTYLDNCIERNELRKGTKTYVPKETLIDMHHSLELPSSDEGFTAVYSIYYSELTNTYVEFRRA